jgi:hypothetical protein
MVHTEVTTEARDTEQGTTNLVPVTGWFKATVIENTLRNSARRESKMNQNASTSVHHSKAAPNQTTRCRRKKKNLISLFWSCFCWSCLLANIKIVQLLVSVGRIHTCSRLQFVRLCKIYWLYSFVNLLVILFVQLC